MKSLFQKRRLLMRGSALLAGIVLIALSGIAVTVFNARTLVVTPNAQLAQAAGADTASATAGEVKKECEQGTVNKVGVVESAQQAGVEIVQTEGAKEDACVIFWCSDDGTRCYLMSPGENASIVDACGSDTGCRTGEAIKKFSAGSSALGNIQTIKDASQFGNNPESFPTASNDIVNNAFSGETDYGTTQTTSGTAGGGSVSQSVVDKIIADSKQAYQEDDTGVTYDSGVPLNPDITTDQAQLSQTTSFSGAENLNDIEDFYDPAAGAGDSTGFNPNINPETGGGRTGGSEPAPLTLTEQISAAADSVADAAVKFGNDVAGGVQELWNDASGGLQQLFGITPAAGAGDSIGFNPNINPEMGGGKSEFAESAEEESTWGDPLKVASDAWNSVTYCASDLGTCVSDTADSAQGAAQNLLGLTPKEAAITTGIVDNSQRAACEGVSCIGYIADQSLYEIGNILAPPAVAKPSLGEDVKLRTTMYFPCKNQFCAMNGDSVTARPGLDGTNGVKTLDDYRLGKSAYVTGASDPSRYKETYEIPEITYRSALDGKLYTLTDVLIYIHDTGGAFKGRPDKLDIAGGWSTSDKNATSLALNQPYLSKTYNTLTAVGSPTGSIATGYVSLPDLAPLPPLRPEPVTVLVDSGQFYSTDMDYSYLDSAQEIEYTSLQGLGKTRGLTLAEPTFTTQGDPNQFYSPNMDYGYLQTQTAEQLYADIAAKQTAFRTTAEKTVNAAIYGSGGVNAPVTTGSITTPQQPFVLPQTAADLYQQAEQANTSVGVVYTSTVDTSAFDLTSATDQYSQFGTMDAAEAALSSGGTTYTALSTEIQNVAVSNLNTAQANYDAAISTVSKEKNFFVKGLDIIRVSLAQKGVLSESYIPQNVVIAQKQLEQAQVAYNSVFGKQPTFGERVQTALSDFFGVSSGPTTPYYDEFSGVGSDGAPITSSQPANNIPIDYGDSVIANRTYPEFVTGGQTNTPVSQYNPNSDFGFGYNPDVASLSDAENIETQVYYGSLSYIQADPFGVFGEANVYNVPTENPAFQSNRSVVNTPVENPAFITNELVTSDYYGYGDPNAVYPDEMLGGQMDTSVPTYDPNKDQGFGYVGETTYLVPLQDTPVSTASQSTNWVCQYTGYLCGGGSDTGTGSQALQQLEVDREQTITRGYLPETASGNFPNTSDLVGKVYDDYSPTLAQPSGVYGYGDPNAVYPDEMLGGEQVPLPPPRPTTFYDYATEETPNVLTSGITDVQPDITRLGARTNTAWSGMSTIQKATCAVGINCSSEYTAAKSALDAALAQQEKAKQDIANYGDPGYLRPDVLAGQETVGSAALEQYYTQQQQPTEAQLRIQAQQVGIDEGIAARDKLVSAYAEQATLTQQVEQSLSTQQEQVNTIGKGGILPEGLRAIITKPDPSADTVFETAGRLLDVPVNLAECGLAVGEALTGTSYYDCDFWTPSQAGQKIADWWNGTSRADGLEEAPPVSSEKSVDVSTPGKVAVASDGRTSASTDTGGGTATDGGIGGGEATPGDESGVTTPSPTDGKTSDLDPYLLTPDIQKQAPELSGGTDDRVEPKKVETISIAKQPPTKTSPGIYNQNQQQQICNQLANQCRANPTQSCLQQYYAQCQGGQQQQRPPQQPQLPQQQQGGGGGSGSQNQNACAKYEGTKLVNGQCTCPDGEEYINNTCQNPDDAGQAASELAAEISCAPKVQDEGKTIAISYACRGPEGLLSNGDGFDTDKKRSGSATTTAEFDIANPGSKVRQFALTCIYQGNTKTSVCEVEINKPWLTIAVTPAQVESGEKAGVGWFSLGMRVCSIRATNDTEEAQAFNTKHALVNATKGITETPALTQNLDIEVLCVTRGGGERIATTTVEVL